MFHGHHTKCLLTEGRIAHPKTDTSLAQLFAEIMTNRPYLKGDCNGKVVEIWKCEWQKIKNEPAIRQLLCATFNMLKPSYIKKVRPIKTQSITSVEDGTLFGHMECDIQVSEEH